jgi:calcium-independent phospholipase A2-gamma
MIISTAVEIGTNQPAIIRSYPSRRTVGPEVPRDLLTWQAMHATLAAPRYVDPSAGPRETTKRAVIQPGFVDYGTAKNSPVRDLCYECRKLYSYTNDTMVIVSIGTGTGTPSPDELKEMTKSVQERTLEAQKWGEKFEIDNRELIKQGWIKYYRFNVDTLHGLPLEEGLAPEAIEAATTAYLAREDVGTQFYAAVGAIVEVLTGHSGPRGQDGESGQ